MSLELTSTTCRTCMDEDSKYYQLDDCLEENLSILEMLGLVIPQINIKNEDAIEFSTLICESCVEKLVACFHFQRLCIDTDSKLREMFSNPAQEIVLDLDNNIDLESNFDAEESKLMVGDILHIRPKDTHDNENTDSNDEENFSQIEDEWEIYEEEIDEVHRDADQGSIKNNSRDDDNTILIEQMNADDTNDSQKTFDETGDIQLPFETIISNGQKMFSCSQCGLAYDRLPLMEKHLENDHEYSDNTLKQIMDLYASKTSEESNTSNIEQKERWDKSRENSCKICGKQFDCMAHLKRHGSVHSSEKPCVCDICHRRFANRDSLRKHTMLHAKRQQEGSLNPIRIRTTVGSGTYLCKICNRKYMSVRSLSSHVRKLHPESTFACTQCDRNFALKEQLSRHMHFHRNVELSCDICNKKFTSELAAKEHKYIHTDESPYLCPTCGKGFKYSSSLRKHVDTHNEEKKYECPCCDTRFKTRESLSIHKKIHLSEKPYKCGKCGLRFSKTYQLKNHRKLHK
ncbi:uncharacterized protein LOC142228712 isoform X2 [Haematobia irritans]|uniref:uncharacterized protein LOC142228712 isoform X2 n=1 Tax=Haematobia irritans TaxID=7368 RepID=UPI003F5074BB